MNFRSLIIIRILILSIAFFTLAFTIYIPNMNSLINKSNNKSLNVMCSEFPTLNNFYGSGYKTPIEQEFYINRCQPCSGKDTCYDYLDIDSNTLVGIDILLELIRENNFDEASYSKNVILEKSIKGWPLGSAQDSLVKIEKKIYRLYENSKNEIIINSRIDPIYYNIYTKYIKRLQQYKDYCSNNVETTNILRRIYHKKSEMSKYLILIQNDMSANLKLTINTLLKVSIFDKHGANSVYEYIADDFKKTANKNTTTALNCIYDYNNKATINFKTSNILYENIFIRVVFNIIEDEDYTGILPEYNIKLQNDILEYNEFAITDKLNSFNNKSMDSIIVGSKDGNLLKKIIQGSCDIVLSFGNKRCSKDITSLTVNTMMDNFEEKLVIEISYNTANEDYSYYIHNVCYTIIS